MNTVRTELKTNQRPTQQTARSYCVGENLFEEGSTGKELFIIQEGKVGVYKDTPDGKVELARIEKGGTIGEMSLLDNLPRSATVSAIEPSKALIINQATFQAILQEVPVWLTSIIKIVVSRLRDANKRVDQAILRDKERGLTSLLILLLPIYRKEVNSKIILDFDLIMLEAFFVCRLKKKEVRKVIENIEKRGILVYEEDTKVQSRLVYIKDLEVLKLFEEYLTLKAQQKTFKECTVPDEAVAILSNIAYVAQKSGTETEDGTALMKSALIADLSDKNSDKLEKNLLDLRRRNLINLMPEQGDIQIIFRKEVLSRLKKIKEWIPKFQMEIQ